MKESMTEMTPLGTGLPDVSQKCNMNKKSIFIGLNWFVFADCYRSYGVNDKCKHVTY